MTTHKIKTFPAGDTIIRQGEQGNSAYIIETGTVEIFIEKENGLVQSLGTRTAGTIIGEMSIVDDEPRLATIKAVEDCELLEISREDFNRRLDDADPIIQMVTKVILTRYRDMMTRAHILGRPHDTPTPDDIEKDVVKSANAVENIKLAHEIENALNNNDLELHYQPIIDVKFGKMTGFESLLRWNHPKKGYISPDHFIPIAEESGLIIDISRWVVQESCNILNRIDLKTKRSDLLFVSVNFSAKDFTQPGFQSYIENNLDKNNLSKDRIHIEITERLLIDQPSKARDILQSCQDAGIPISIDDFGTGYSSLSYLHYFPINILKIDRSFVKDIENDDSAFELVKSIISLAHNMKMSVIAEGIEEEKQANLLKEIGCDKIQGYYYARPMPEADLLQYLAENTK